MIDKEQEEKIIKGMEAYKRRIEENKTLYVKVLNSIPEDYKEKIYKITDRELFNKIISSFITALNQEDAKEDLMKVYDIAVHMKTKALIIANKGATLYSVSEEYKVPYLVRHIGISIYLPGIGIEYVNAGIVGNIYDDKFVLRTESACAPSFIFGSQRCNCYYQWKNVRELAAHFNSIETPKITDGDEFEHWVQQQFKYNNGKHIYQSNSRLGVLMLHLDSQNGMGSGYTKNEFAFDLTDRAAIRHRGEYTSEQTFNTTMYGGFTSIGLMGDPRAAENGVGYSVTPIVLDFLQVNDKIILLTNNPKKIKKINEYGYEIIRVKSLGEVNVAGSTEAEQRGSEFEHFDICGTVVTFKEDYNRMKEEIEEIIAKK